MCEAAAKVGNSRALFEDVKKLTGQKRAEITKIQDKDKVMHTKQKEIVEIFSNYFDKLLNVKNTIKDDLVKKIKERIILLPCSYSYGLRRNVCAAY